MVGYALTLTKGKKENRMKKIHIWSFGLIIFLIGCEDKNTNALIDESLKEFISVDLKQNGPEFFTFSENPGFF